MISSVEKLNVPTTFVACSRYDNLLYHISNNSRHNKVWVNDVGYSFKYQDDLDIIVRQTGDELEEWGFVRPTEWRKMDSRIAKMTDAEFVLAFNSFVVDFAG